MNRSVPVYSSSKHILYVWLILVLSTLGAWLWVERHEQLSSMITLLIIGLAALKAFLVIYFYMEIKYAPLWLKALCLLWMVLVFGIICINYLVLGH